MQPRFGKVLVLALIAVFGCEAAERGDREAAPGPTDTIRIQDTATAVGDSLMARDTIP